MSTLKITTGAGKHYTAMVTFAKNGGSVAVDHDGTFQTYKFDAKNVKDEGNFLVAFLHREGYSEPTIRYKRKTYEYVTPTHTEFPYVAETLTVYTAPDGTVTTFDGNMGLYDISLFSELDVTVEEFLSRTVIKKVYRFSNNTAINEILNFNNVTPEYFEKNPDLVKTINKYITTGSNHIDPKLSGTKWRVDSARAYRLDGNSGFKKDVFLIP